MQYYYQTHKSLVRKCKHTWAWTSQTPWQIAALPCTRRRRWLQHALRQCDQCLRHQHTPPQHEVEHEQRTFPESIVFRIWQGCWCIQYCRLVLAWPSKQCAGHSELMCEEGCERVSPRVLVWSVLLCGLCGLLCGGACGGHMLKLLSGRNNAKLNFEQLDLKVQVHTP
jgi:hypothetical protein